MREGLAANLSSIKGCQVSAYVLPKPNLPCLEVYPSEADGTEYHQAMRNGLHRWHFAVRGMVAMNDGIAAQQKLDAWLSDSGPDSVFAALESDPTLGGAAGGLIVRGHSGYGEGFHPTLQAQVLAVLWNVEVLAAGT